MSGWPWPLNAVQGWFDGLWSWIGEAPQNAVSVVHDWVYNGLNWIWTHVQNVGSWIVDSATALFNQLSTKLGSLGAQVQAWLSSGINSLWTVVSDTGAWLYGTITTFFSDLQAAMSTAAANLSGAISGGISALTSGLSELGGSLTSTLGGLFDGAHKWITDGMTWLKEGVIETGSNIINSVGGAIGGAFETLAGGVTAVFGPVLGGIEYIFKQLGSLGPGFDVTGLVSEAMATLENIMAATTKALSSHSPRTPTEAYTITWDTINQVSAAYMTQTISLIIAEAASIGQLDISTQGLAHTPQMESALSTCARLYDIMADISLYRPLTHYMNRAFTPEIPPVPDLIRFVVREVITPERFQELMPFHGFSPEFASDYWEAHWVLPARGELVDAFHRKVIDAAELDKFLVWHDYSPKPRPGIAKSDVEILRGILKTLIPRVDIRYAWEMGLIDDAGLEDWYGLLGYEEDAPLMAAIQKVRALTEEINKVRNEDLAAFVDGLQDEATLRANLEALGIGPGRIDYYVEYAKKRRERNQAKELLDIYQDGYVNDLLDDVKLKEVAADLIVDERARSLFLDRAYVRKYMAPRLTPSD